MERIRQILVTLVGVCLLGVVGCNTENWFAPQQTMDAPVADMKSTDSSELPDIQLVEAREVDLVENVVQHRTMYHRQLRALRDYYQEHGYDVKRQWADTELAGVEKTQPFKYLLSAQIPVDSLRPASSITEADSMYEHGRELMIEGGHRVPGVYRRDLMVKALSTFVDLVRKYPSSDKVDDAAFYCGEIHKEYLNQNSLAVKWYERAYAWDPTTPHNARFQAAVTYDYRLHDRARALELYRAVVETENRNKSNVSWAVRRIDELTTELATKPATEDSTAQPVSKETRVPADSSLSDKSKNPTKTGS